MRPVALLGFLAVVPLLAGCFGGDDGGDASPGSASPQTFVSKVGEPEPPKVPESTSTLHFLGGHTLTTIPPDAFEPARVPITSPAGAPMQLADILVGGNTDVSQWNFTWPVDQGVVKGSATLFVEVDGLVVNGGAAGDPAQDACFWHFTFSILDSDPQSENGGSTLVCFAEPFLVPEGPRTLTFDFELPASTYGAGYSAHVSVGSYAVAQSPDARVDLLTGARNHDSRITLESVGWPLDLGEVTLLTTTTA